MYIVSLFKDQGWEVWARWDGDFQLYIICRLFDIGGLTVYRKNNYPESIETCCHVGLAMPLYFEGPHMFVGGGNQRSQSLTR